MADTPKKKSLAKRAVQRINDDNERGARQTVIEELFNDYNRNKFQIYWVNLLRGFFFGIGSVLGASLIVLVLVWLSGFFVDWPGIGDFFQQLNDALRTRPR